MRRARFSLRECPSVSFEEDDAHSSDRLGENPKLCFEKYVDAVIDLLIPGHSPGIKERLVDLYGKPELLFFGPDGQSPPLTSATHSLTTWCYRGHCRPHGLGSQYVSLRLFVCDRS